MDRTRLQILGPLELRSADGTQIFSVLRRPRRLALLTYLTLESRDGFVRRGTLLPFFWPESDEEHARAALRKALFQLRRSLGPDAIVGRETEELRVAPDRVWCDAVAFEEACDRGDLERALELWGGEPFSGLDIPGLPEFEEWREEQRVRLRRLATDTCVALVNARLADGHAVEAVRLARSALKRSPYDETVLRCLIRSLDAAGDRAGALQAFRVWAERFESELGGLPSPETVALMAVVQERTGPAPSAPPRARPAPAREGQPSAPTRGRRRLLRWAPWMAAAVVTVVGASIAFSTASDRAPPGGRVFAVLPFDYRGDADHRYLGGGMMSLLGASLERGQENRALDTGSLTHALGLEEGQVPDVAEADGRVGGLGATHLVAGTVVVTGTQIQLEAALFRRGRPGRPIQRATVRGAVQDVFALTGELANRLLPGVRPSAASPASEARLTRSLPALEAFLDGEQATRDGDYLGARSAYERAVTYDSSFSLAHLRLAIVRDWVGGDPARVDAALKDAVRTAERLSPGERELLATFLARSQGEIDRALTLAETLVAQRPDMAQAWFELGEVRFHYGAMLGYTVEEQVAPFRRVVELDPGSAGALLHIARVDVREADSAAWHELDTEIRAFGRLSTGEPELTMYRALRSGNVAALDSAMAAIGRAGPSTRSFELRYLAVATLDPVMVQRYGAAFEEGMDEPLIEAHILPAMLQAGRGQVRRALAQLAETGDAAYEPMLALLATLPFLPDTMKPEAMLPASLSLRQLRAELDTDRSGPAFLDGLLALAAGDVEGARAIAAHLRNGAGMDPAMALQAEHDGRVLEAHLAWVRGDPAAALVILGPARAHRGSRPSPDRDYVEVHERFLRSECLLGLGRAREALRWFQGFPEPGATDLHYIGIATLRRAQIHEALGDKTAAIATYERFLQLWQEPDPALAPLRASALEALRRLRA